MGSVTRSITDFFRGKEDIAERLRRMQPACRGGTGGKRVFIKVFDRKNVLSDAAHSISEAKQDLEAFFNNLSATPSLPAPVAQDLQTFSFDVTFVTRDSNKDEREGLGMMDFPVYIETTIGSTAFTTDEGEALLLAHKIPEITEVFRPTDDEGTVAREPLQSYSAIDKFIPKHDAFGAGVPGTYLMENSQTRRRKIGIIKVNDLIEGINSVEIRQKRFLLVLKHELGHMFGMAHDPNTLMDERYDVAINHPNYSIGQVLILDSTLNILAQG